MALLDPHTFRFKLAAAFLGLLIVVIALLNTYPLYVVQNRIVEAKRQELTTKAEILSATLGTMAGLSAGDIELAVSFLDLGQSMVRLLVMDESGLVVFDNVALASQVGRYSLLPETLRALEGLNVFRCSYQAGSFATRLAVPVMSGEKVAGCVYFYDYDDEQGAILQQTRRYLWSMSVALAVAALVFIAFFSSYFGRRVGKLLNGIAMMKEGRYGYQVDMAGRDEFSRVAGEFNQLAVRLQKTEEVRRAFVSDASHELKTPLAAIKLLSDSIIQTENIDPKDVKEFLADIGEEVDRLTRITDKLLELTRLDEDRTGERVTVDVAEGIKRSAARLRLICRQYDVTIRLNLDEGCLVEADPDGMYHIVFNLMENAVKYNVTGGWVEVGLKKEQGCVLFTVKNSGEGIPAADLPHVFERFYRVDKARSRQTGGSGLGLSIVRLWVDSFGGSIELESVPGQYTRFRVAFPEAGGDRS